MITHPWLFVIGLALTTSTGPMVVQSLITLDAPGIKGYFLIGYFAFFLGIVLSAMSFEVKYSPNDNLSEKTRSELEQLARELKDKE